MEKLKIANIRPMADFLKSQGKVVEFNGEVYLITFENGRRGVFKSVDDIADAYGEVAAYKASTILGFPYVPETVLYEMDDKFGSLQEYVEPDYDLLAEGNYMKALSSVSKDELEKLKLFCFVFGQWDTGPHNLLMSNDHLFAIDNSGIKNKQYVRYGELPFVRRIYSDELNTDDFDKPFPFDSAQVIKKPTSTILRHEFGAKLPESFYEAFNSYGEDLKYVIYRNSLWKQYHAFDTEFVVSYVTEPSQKIIDSIRKIDYEMLEEIFSDHINEFDLEGILDRRDQVIEHFESNLASHI